MKIILKSALCLAVLFFSHESLAAARIAVVDFDTTQYSYFDIRSQRVDLAGQQFAEYVIDELVNTDMFEVVEREKLRTVINELGFSKSGFVDQSSAPRIGRLLGAKYLLTGKITNVGMAEERFQDFGMDMNVLNVTLTASIRIINTQTGSIVFSTRAKGEKKLKAGSFGGGYQMSSSDSLAEELADQLAIDLIDRLRESGKTFP